MTSTPQAADPLGSMVRSPDYLRLLSYVTSNARQGEIMAVDHYAQMVLLIDDPIEKRETVKQAHEECKHIVLLEKLAVDIGFPIDADVVQPAWRDIRAHFDKAAQRKDLAACLIIQDLMVESLAIAMYKTFAGAANGDPETARVANKLLADELEHLDVGVRRIQALMAKDADAVHDSLAFAHHRVMPAMFEMVHGACDWICAKNGLDCDAVDKGAVTIDLDMLKVEAFEHYVNMLFESGFRPAVVNALVASMAAYEPAATLDLRSVEVRRAACDPSTGCC